MLIPLRRSDFTNVVEYIKSSSVHSYTIYKEGLPNDENPNYGVRVTYLDEDECSRNNVVAFEHVFKDLAMVKDLAAVRNWVLLTDATIDPFTALQEQDKS